MTEKSTVLQGGRVKLADYGMNRHLARIPVSHDLAMVESPGYFRNYADSFAGCIAKGAMRLEVLSDDYSLHAEYLVLQATRTDAKLRRIHLHCNNIVAPPETEAKRFKMSWGARQKWRVLDGDAVAAKGMEKDDCVALVAALNSGTKAVEDIPKDYAA